jgi:uroporphyrinogen-III decarboxylase
MTSRERLLAALAGQAADRVPISTYELCGYNSHSFENQDPSYANLMQVIRERTDCVTMWEPKSNATVFESSHPVKMEIEERREGHTLIRRKTLHTPKGDIFNTTKILDNLHTVWQVEYWCKNTDDVEKVLSIPYQPVDYDFSDYDRISEEVGERGIIMSSPADPLWLAADLMDCENYTMWAMFEAEHFQRVVEIMHERNMENLRRSLDVKALDLYRICGPEYATPPFLPPELFQRFVVPYVSEMIELIRERGAHSRLHCHGNISKVLDMIAAMQPDSMDPCEAPPDGDIALGDIKKRVGSQMCLFGNIQLKDLEMATSERIEEIVKTCMNEAKEGGGYVIMPTAAPINSPLSKKTEENYIRFIDAALKYGEY